MVGRFARQMTFMGEVLQRSSGGERQARRGRARSAPALGVPARMAMRGDGIRPGVPGGAATRQFTKLSQVIIDIVVTLAAHHSEDCSSLILGMRNFSRHAGAQKNRRERVFARHFSSRNRIRSFPWTGFGEFGGAVTVWKKSHRQRCHSGLPRTGCKPKKAVAARKQWARYPHRSTGSGRGIAR